ncbi:hypothetical protein AMECASPLE_039747 [Ameca splendens]|uniref:Uncharacterized protein n=1 Tax=Ameca splendens TaxID=208324 RepID=A0ABV1AFT4_9TELE
MKNHTPYQSVEVMHTIKLFICEKHYKKKKKRHAPSRDCHHMTSRIDLLVNVRKMAAFLQWRKFVFFDKDTVKDPVDSGKTFALPRGISASDSGRGHVVLGDILLCCS